MQPLKAVPQRATGIMDEMRQFLCSQYWLPEGDFPLCSDIFAALGLTGDDCHEFMDNYANRYSIDLTDYIWPKFHLSESEAQDVRSVLRPFMRFAGLKAQPLNRDLIPISIDHLLRVTQHGRWFDPTTDEAPEKVGITRNISRFGARLKAGGIPKRQS